MGSSTVSPPVVQTKALVCPNCGGGVQLRGFAHTLVVTCEHCGAVLDSTTPLLRILIKHQEKVREPMFPLGSRGTFYGTLYEAIGFQVRGIIVEATHYRWCEYVLFNPYKGFLYLTEYQAHWNVVRPLSALPSEGRRGMNKTQSWQGRTYRHFQHALAKTEYVMGEFPWQVRVGEQVAVDDYIAPPYVLSGETTHKEVTWSLGEYTAGKQIWEAFKLPGSPPVPSGIYENQPAPQSGAQDLRRLCGIFILALLAIAIYFGVTARGAVVLTENHTFHPDAKDQAFVTSTFELTGHPSSVEIQTRTDLNNNWLYFNYALINIDNGQAYDFGREVSYYYGSDSDGSWSEGGKNDSVTIPAVPAGKYYLRVEPESDEKASVANYQIIVKRDVPSYLLYLLAAILLVIPVIVVTWRSAKFEYRRWQESDYSGSSLATSSSSGDDD